MDCRGVSDGSDRAMLHWQSDFVRDERCPPFFESKSHDRVVAATLIVGDGTFDRRILCVERDKVGWGSSILACMKSYTSSRVKEVDRLHLAEIRGLNINRRHKDSHR